jgi:hypothetical protein
MVLLAGALSLSDTWAGKDEAAKLAAATARYPQLSATCEFQDDRLSLYSIERPTGYVTSHLIGKNEHECLWLFGEIPYNVASVRSSTTRLTDWQYSNDKVVGRWLSVYYNSKSGILRVSNDLMGLAWLFVARIPHGYFFSSDFGALARSLPNAPQLNNEALMAEFSLGRSFGNQTIFQDISIVSPGSVTELTSNGLKSTQQRSIQYGDANAKLSKEQKFSRLDDIFNRIIDQQISSFDAEVVLSFSAGYDSRTALACLQRRGIDTSLFTFGHPDSQEIAGANRVARRLDKSTQLFPIVSSTWSDWVDRVNVLGSCGMLQFAGWTQAWLSLLRARSEFVVIGYLGDALTGKKITKIHSSLKNDDWMTSWINWEIAQRGSLHSSYVMSEIKQSSEDELVENLRAELSGYEFRFPFQQALHGDLFGRQRRRVASQPNIISRFITPVMFFYDEDLINFWANLPYEDFHQQNLYLSYCKDRFPRLFPSQENRVTGDSQRRATLLDHLWQRLRGQPMRSPPVIDHARLIRQHQSEIVDLISRQSSSVSHIFDVTMLRNLVESNRQSTGRVSPAEAIQLINLMIILDLRT